MKALRNLSSALGVGFFLVAPDSVLASSNPLDNWQIVTNSMQSLRGMAYLNGRFVAVGSSANVVVSTNGSDWFTATNGLSSFEGLLAVAAGAGQFVAVGAPRAAILSSPDGIHWTRHYSLAGADLWAVTYAGGQFVAVGYNNTGSVLSATSPDGIQWDVRTAPIVTTPRNIAWGKGIYVAAGAPVSLLSTNGRDWTAIPSVIAQGVAFDGTRFIATLLTNAFAASDGVNWTLLPLPDLVGAGSQNYYTVAYANRTLIAGGNARGSGLLVTSSDGGPFAPIPTAIMEGMGAIRDIVFADGRFYLTDQSGKIWRSGRVPPASPPRFTRVSKHGEQILLGFTGPAGFQCVVETTERLAPPGWQFSIGPIFADGEEVILTDSNPTDATRFYRVRTE